ncbi:hypothetical protein Q5752_001053 [Cryptotrichosporon argae]
MSSTNRTVHVVDSIAAYDEQLRTLRNKPGKELTEAFCLAIDPKSFDAPEPFASLPAAPTERNLNVDGTAVPTPSGLIVLEDRSEQKQSFTLTPDEMWTCLTGSAKPSDIIPTLLLLNPDHLSIVKAKYKQLLRDKATRTVVEIVEDDDTSAAYEAFVCSPELVAARSARTANERLVLVGTTSRTLG